MKSSRQSQWPASSFLLVLLLCFIITFTSIHYRAAILSLTLVAFQHGVVVQQPSLGWADYINIANVFEGNATLLPNQHITSILQCTHKVNNITNSIRLSNHIQNISLTPADDTTGDSSEKHFNPTLIQLPSYSPYPYLLLSRLVTKGLHQESHICLASLCHTQDSDHPQGLPIDARVCSDSDIEALGPGGGIRCMTKPERLNIPPTPAFRCEGAWAAFPDIPGFHDPRVFWSGKGEPLVIINSGSQYACVGLWIVDLRAVYPELRDLLRREGKYVGLDSKRSKDGVDVPIQTSYPHLTELTRNDRASRNAIEKNWILFFPKAGESWVQYDLVGHAGHEKGMKNQSVDASSPASMPNLFNIAEEAKFNNSTTGISHVDSTLITSGHRHDVSQIAAGPELSLSGEENSNNTNRARSNVERSSKFNHVDQKPVLTPARSLAKLIGSGYTTSNLTSSSETPCLTTADLVDNIGDHGHWHQGSNSLRLILCSRHDTACFGSGDENELVNQGKVVHFAILHRKFSNELDLPMRYERYIMVWEAIYPFRMVGISRYPLLFAGERAQPWTDTENELEGSENAKMKADVYFTYTPSLSWSWRKDIVMKNDQNAASRLGTGFLGDDVLVGIGMDDVAQGFARLKVDDLLDCLRLCPDFATPKPA